MSGPLATRRRVEFRDTDAAGIAHFSAFFVWMESAEHELLRSVGVELVDRVSGADGPETVSWPRVSAACDYDSALRFNDEFDVHVGVAAIGRTSVTWVFRFLLDGRPVARGRVVSVRCRIAAEAPPAPVAVPEDVRRRLSVHEVGEPPAAG